jgi:hypothetical protein
MTGINLSALVRELKKGGAELFVEAVRLITRGEHA